MEIINEGIKNSLNEHIKLCSKEQNYFKAMSLEDLGKSLANILSSKMKSLHKVFYVETWLTISPLPPYLSNIGISIPCGIFILNISKDKGFFSNIVKIGHFYFGSM